ncbi:MAG TPA: LCP family protein, partial [Candidatus Nitrosotenuis sp.]|nr:LCP family protein [Candidatus Nitrosotenuis sp.]
MILFSLVVFVLAVLALVGGFAYIGEMERLARTGGEQITWTQLLEFVNNPGQSVFRSKKRLNVLCLGIDYNYTDQGILYTKGARSDTIFVVSLDSEASTLNVLSIPRDTQVELAYNHGYEKINAAYALGGLDLVRATVERFLGVPIDHYVIIKVDAAARLVDALGGLSINVEKDMDYDDNWGHLHIHLKKGPQVLKGQQVVGYARFRMDEEGDRGRIRRQQQVMAALVSKLKDPALVTKYDELCRIAKENIETDFSVLDLIGLAYLYKDFDRSKMRTGAIVGDDADINGISYIIPYGPENERLVRELLKDPSDVRLGEVRVEILNGTGIDGLAGQVAEELRQKGFTVVRVGDAERTDYARTRVVDHLGNAEIRALLERLLSGAQVEIDPAAGRGKNPDITVVVGKDRLPRAQAPEPYPTYGGPQAAAAPPPAPPPRAYREEPEPLQILDTGAE